MPGAEAVAVDKAARDVIERAGLPDFFGPALAGTASGCRSTRTRRSGSDGDRKLDACMPVTVEPGLYLPGGGGVRIE